MQRSYFTAAGLLFLLGTPAAFPESLSEDLFDPPPSDGLADLKEKPLWIEITSALGLKFKDNSLESNFKGQFDALQGQMEGEITGTKNGFLLKVEEYEDESNTPVIPSGQIVSPIGTGTEPIDALAENDRHPQLQNPRPRNVRDESYYIWVKERDGKLTGSIIPREFREKFEENAVEEARRRDMLGEWEKALPPGGLKSLQRATYWNDVATQYLVRLDSIERQNEIAELTRKYAEAEKNFNDAYTKFQETEKRMSDAAGRMKTLQAVATVTKLIGEGIQLGEVACTDPSTATPASDKTPSTAGQPTGNVSATLEYEKETYDSYSGQWSKQRASLTVQGADLQKRNDELRQKYLDGKIKPPNADDQLRVP
jgi:hypothetical protein